MSTVEEIKEAVKIRIREAFAKVEHPGDGCLHNSGEGNEPFLLEEEFKGTDDWGTLDAHYIDQAPAGFGTALGFFQTKHSVFISLHI
jgi:hypothetical protein